MSYEQVDSLNRDRYNDTASSLVTFFAVELTGGGDCSIAVAACSAT